MKNKKLKITVVLLLVVPAVMLGMFLWYIYGTGILDGPGMAYTWTDYELYGDWVAITEDSTATPVRLKFTADTITCTDASGVVHSYAYQLPVGIDTYGVPDSEIYFDIAEFDFYYGLVFHEDRPDGEALPVISATLFEADGGGEIVVAEFVHTDAADGIPAGFRSEFCRRCNDSEAIPACIEADQETP